jgi:hypothetical protein
MTRRTIRITITITIKKHRSKQARRFLRIRKIISGGQTGADRAALDFAIEHSIPHGGWCPAGRLAEDGKIHRRYRLKQTPSSVPAQRTEWNVRDADATVIFSIRRTLSGGSKLTQEFARSFQKSCLQLSRTADSKTAPRKLRRFLKKHSVQILNVAGPRLSSEPNIAIFTSQTLKAARLSS